MRLTVAELPEYLRAPGKLLTDADRRSIVDHVAGPVDVLVQIWFER